MLGTCSKYILNIEYRSGIVIVVGLIKIFKINPIQAPFIGVIKFNVQLFKLNILRVYIRGTYDACFVILILLLSTD